MVIAHYGETTVTDISTPIANPKPRKSDKLSNLKSPKLGGLKPTPAKPIADDGAELVSGNELARHLYMSRQNIDALVSSGVIERRGDGLFDQAQCRLRYIKHLQSERRGNARAEADAALSRSKARMLQLRIGLQEKELMHVSDHLEAIDALCGLFLEKITTMPARCSRDLDVRRSIDKVARQIRDEIADEYKKKAEEMTA
jgi:hypothetical protein